MNRAGIDSRRIQIVLVEPLYGGNIGQVARAMMNFGFSRLVLVNPREHRTPEAYWMAREGKRILDEAELHTCLEGALQEAGLAVGTTRRVGKYRRPALTPEAFAVEVGPFTRENTVALVFGREDSGLTAAELALCQWIVTIPASEVFPSLNLAQAVLLMGYTLFRAGREPSAEPAEGAGLHLAGPQELERFYAHLEETLGAIGFLSGDHAPAILISLRRIFGRANLEPRDVRILRGVLGQMDWYRRNAAGPVLESERRAGAPAIAKPAGRGGAPATASGGQSANPDANPRDPLVP